MILGCVEATIADVLIGLVLLAALRVALYLIW